MTAPFKIQIPAEDIWAPGGVMMTFVEEICARTRANRAAHPERYGYRPKAYETDFDFFADEQGLTPRRLGWENL